ncbi:MAG: FAD-dependent oxidoreductase [Hadesarchaea archaeon]|jgi:Pyruvate/2-oxoacid:ferredoxin oxidoreductase delta subunit|nr:FAD-dependent oxidoreductase [Hadesarchaea archaeon]
MRLLPGLVIDRPGSSAEYLTSGWRYLRPVREKRTAPCARSCPIGNDLPGILYLVGRGRMEEAWRLLKATNPFPSVCGRVCYRFCESACNRGELDEPLAIRAVERFLGDLGRERGWRVEAGKPTGREVAVVGGGPAGLSCAYHLRLLGHGVRVFEAREREGGLMAWGMPEEHLPRAVLEEELASLREMGVEVERGRRVEGRRELEGYGAVVLATGREPLPEGLRVERADEWGRTGVEGVFAAGELAGERRGVARAVGSGRRVALAVDAFLRGREPEPLPAPSPVGPEEIKLDYFTPSPRVGGPSGPGSEEEVRAEAGRCFSCGSCNGCDNCWILCPEACIRKEGEREYRTDEDYCKGCGICAAECPRAVIRMVEEGT